MKDKFVYLKARELNPPLLTSWLGTKYNRHGYEIYSYITHKLHTIMIQTKTRMICIIEGEHKIWNASILRSHSYG